MLEAFTNNTSTMKTKLISIPRTSLMYLPEIVLNETTDHTKMHNTKPNQSVFLVAVDSATELALQGGLGAAGVLGVINGFTVNNLNKYIRLDQGLNTNELSPNADIAGDLFETQYIIEMDNRFGSIWSVSTAGGARQARLSFIDDDNIASYYLSYTTDNPDFVTDLLPPGVLAEDVQSVIKGPKGSKIQFVVKASIDLISNNFLFSQLGSTGLLVAGDTPEAATYRYLDSSIRVTGVTTGYRVDVPVRYVKRDT